MGILSSDKTSGIIGSKRYAVFIASSSDLANETPRNFRRGLEVPLVVHLKGSLCDDRPFVCYRNAPYNLLDDLLSRKLARQVSDAPNYSVKYSLLKHSRIRLVLERIASCLSARRERPLSSTSCRLLFAAKNERTISTCRVAEVDVFRLWSSVSNYYQTAAMDNNSSGIVV